MLTSSGKCVPTRANGSFALHRIELLGKRSPMIFLRAFRQGAPDRAARVPSKAPPARARTPRCPEGDRDQPQIRKQIAHNRARKYRKSLDDERNALAGAARRAICRDACACDKAPRNCATDSPGPCSRSISDATQCASSSGVPNSTTRIFSPSGFSVFSLLGGSSGDFSLCGNHFARHSKNSLR